MNTQFRLIVCLCIFKRPCSLRACKLGRNRHPTCRTCRRTMGCRRWSPRAGRPCVTECQSGFKNRGVLAWTYNSNRLVLLRCKPIKGLPARLPLAGSCQRGSRGPPISIHTNSAFHTLYTCASLRFFTSALSRNKMFDLSVPMRSCAAIAPRRRQDGTVCSPRSSSAAGRHTASRTVQVHQRESQAACCQIIIQKNMSYLS